MDRTAADDGAQGGAPEFELGVGPDHRRERLGIQVGRTTADDRVPRPRHDGWSGALEDGSPQGFVGVTTLYLKSINGNDLGGGQPVNSGPAFVTKHNADAVLKYAANGTR